MRKYLMGPKSRTRDDGLLAKTSGDECQAYSSYIAKCDRSGRPPYTGFVSCIEHSKVAFLATHGAKEQWTTPSKGEELGNLGALQRTVPNSQD